MGNKLKVEIPFLKYYKGGGFYLHFDGKYNSCWCRYYPEARHNKKNHDLRAFVFTETTVLVDKLQKGYIFYLPSNNSIIEKTSYQCKNFLRQNGFSFEGFPFPDSFGWSTETPKKKKSVPNAGPSSSEKKEQKPKTCRYCGKKGLSPRAHMCPNCGEPLRNK